MSPIGGRVASLHGGAPLRQAKDECAAPGTAWVRRRVPSAASLLVSIGVYRRSPQTCGRARPMISPRQPMSSDFISGERVLPRKMFNTALEEMSRLPRWGGEVFINELIIEQRLKVQVVDWADVFHTPKGEKVGSKKAGAKQEWKMFQDMVRVLSPFGIIRQHWGLMRLAGVFFFKTLNLLVPAPAPGLTSSARGKRPAEAQARARSGTGGLTLFEEEDARPNAWPECWRIIPQLGPCPGHTFRSSSHGALGPTFSTLGRVEASAQSITDTQGAL